MQFNPTELSSAAAGAASQPFLMAAGNRVDLLVRVPQGATGPLKLQVYDVVKADRAADRRRARRKRPRRCSP